MQTVILEITGMMCDACVGHVTKALQSLDGVQSAAVSLKFNQAIVNYDSTKVNIAKMADVVAEEGYTATSH